MGNFDKFEKMMKLLALVARVTDRLTNQLTMLRLQLFSTFLGGTKGNLLSWKWTYKEGKVRVGACWSRVKFKVFLHFVDIGPNDVLWGTSWSWNIGWFLKRFHLALLASSSFQWLSKEVKNLTKESKGKGLSLSKFSWYLVIVKIIKIRHSKGLISQTNHDSKNIFMLK